MATLGADPEFFVMSETTKQPVAAGVFLKASKQRPHSLGEDGYAVQQDNVMVEYNVPPCGDWKTLSKVLRVGMVKAHEHCDKLYRKKAKTGLRIVAEPELFWTRDNLERSPGASEFGCSPEFDAYTNMGNAPIIADRTGWSTEEGEWRTAGGHLHFGLTSPAPVYVAAMMADLAFCRHLASDPAVLRRKSYGLPGRFRPTSYGFEYRSLSNWYLFDQDKRNMILIRAFQLARLLESEEGVIRNAYMNTPWKDLREAIVARDTKALISVERATSKLYGWQ